MAFRECHNLKTFRLNANIRELGWFCFWKAGIMKLDLPPYAMITREYLGLDQHLKMLCLPRGLEAVGDFWFYRSDIEKVFIPNTVKELGKSVFGYCEKMCEVVFEPDSHLETIGDNCFSNCVLREIVIPKSVRSIGDAAFRECLNLRSLTFEEGSQLAHVGKRVIFGTSLIREKVKFPNIEMHSDEETSFFNFSLSTWTYDEEL